MPDGSMPLGDKTQPDLVRGLDLAVDSPVIRRLIEEVRAEVTGVQRSYNRTFNRHNR